MITDPHETQAQFDREVAEIAAMDTETSTGPALSPLRDMNARAEAMAVTAAEARAADPRQLLIAKARDINAAYGLTGQRDYLARAGSEFADGPAAAVEGAFTGRLKNMVAILADALEREINRNA